ncbi:MAG: HEAT repeat domain-containing protein [Elusimicrobiota bacterium]|jgi:cyclophilin family peptidyl-prolyl cis-trans isomerase
MTTLLLLLLAASPLSGQTAAPDADLRTAEDLREPDSALLRTALSDASAERRARAARAMGRIGSAGYLDGLLRALRDDSARVRSDAAFSVGLVAAESTSPASGAVTEALEEAFEDPAAAVRLAALDALGRAGGADEQDWAARLLREKDPAVREAAALALFRMRLLERVPAYSTAAVQGLLACLREESPSRWACAYAFSRWPSKEAAGSLAEAITASDPRARLFSLRSLSKLGAAAPAEAGEECLEDGDERVRVEALALLRAAGGAERISARTLADPSPRVRAAAAEALGNREGDPAALRRLLLDGSSSVRAEAAAGLSARLGDKAARELKRAASDNSWWVRLRAAESALKLPREGPRLLAAALKDEDVRVRAAALRTFAEGWPKESRAALSTALRDASAPLEVRGAAVEAAAKLKEPSLLPDLEECYRLSFSREFVELRESLVEAGSALAATAPKSAELQRWRERLLEDPAPSVRAAAAKALGRPAPAPEAPSPSPLLAEPVPAPGTRVSLLTSKGELILELAPEEAPTHSANLVSLVRRGFYDGKVWHRVVPNFVVQGGDPRGTGWGDAGYFLRDETTPLRFARGTLGMPRAGKDTGGCQLFITLIDAPHLDGRYTAFGRVVIGLDVLDRLEPGDYIVKATLK